MEFCNDGLFIFPQPRESVPILSKPTSLLSIIEHPRPDPTEHLPSSFYYSAGHFFPTVLPRPQCGVAATPFPSYSPYRESQHLSLLPHWAQRPPSQSCALPWLHLPTGLNTGIVAVLPLSGWCPLTTNISNFDEVQFFFFLLTLLVSYLRNCYINLWSQKFICMFPVRSFIVKAPIFRSFISWVNSCKRCIEGVQIHSFSCGHPAVQHHLLKRLFFHHWMVLLSSGKQLTMAIQDYFWALNSIPCLSLSLLSHYLEYSNCGILNQEV